MIARLNRVLRPLRKEDGMTLIEVLVATIVLALAAMATFGVLAATTRNAQRAQALQVALDKAQEEMEKLQTLSYEELALEDTPEFVNDPFNPNYRVSGDSFAVNRNDLAKKSEMAYNGGTLYASSAPVEGGVVLPGPFSFQEGNVSGKIFRYIVWRDDPQCPENPEDLTKDFCPGWQDYKQIIVAVKLDSTASEPRQRNYVEVQSKVVDPDKRAQRSTQGENVGNGGTGEGTEQEEKEREEKEKEEDQTGGASSGKAITGQQFFLSDTPCSPIGTTSRAAITGDHLLHNTLGTCASGLQTGQSKPGAPDALVRGAPPDPDPVDEFNPLLYDYSSDSYLEPTPDTDKGTQILHDDSAGCNYVPKSSVHPEAKVHRWVTDPMPREFKMSGTVTLEFYSRTLNELNYPGTLCVFLFIRSEAGTGESTVATDTLLADPEGKLFWAYSSQEWPRTVWEKLRLTMKLSAATSVHEGQRLGVALSVDAGTTDADAIPIMYDHPNYPSRLEVDTTTPFEGG
jgi:prepilin-type N-terminal cleavage/methylation domain-containing protein